MIMTKLRDVLEYRLPYLVIRTNRVLRNPRSVGVKIDGPALGIKKYYVEYKLINVNYVLWLLGSEARLAHAREVRSFVIPRMNEVCIKRGFEVVCHYPLSMTKVIRAEAGLTKFMRWGP